MFGRVFLNLLTILCMFSMPIYGDEELVFSNLLWRHGARSAIHSYKNDPFNQTMWPQGFGQLTQIGMHQHYELGSYLKQRYNTLLSRRYNRSEIYIRSTDFDRTLMSAESNMAGLFPPEGKQKWNGTNTSWQPVPIHTVPKILDSLLLAPIITCPKLQQLHEKTYSSLEYIELQNKYTEFLKNISFWSGNDNVNLTSSWNVLDTLITEKTQGKTLPLWASDAVMDKLHEIAALDILIRFSGMNSKYREDIGRIVAGNLIKQIVTNINNSINGSESYKVIAYSAHDTTIGSLLVALDSFNNRLPPFAACVMIEVYKDKSSSPPEYIVRSYYRNSTGDPIKLNILDCGFNCSLNEFVTKSQKMFPRGPAQDCGKIPTTGEDFFASHLQLIFIILTCLLVVTWLLIIIVCCKKKCKSKNLKMREVAYQPVPSFDEHLIS
uniref:acid phosphatase n=1 Tax=Ciona intestinalis TaxID=7719 RepID=F7A686_CIOIN|nr:prostatic acid phosphatase-like [Ciona intestinalis]|eukprot:XP_002130958.1 prostatic acid phosphatase-like [Ciona intestinalis]